MVRVCPQPVRRHHATGRDNVAGMRVVGRADGDGARLRQRAAHRRRQLRGFSVRLDGQRLCNEPHEDKLTRAAVLAPRHRIDAMGGNHRLGGVFPDSLRRNAAMAGNSGTDNHPSHTENPLRDYRPAADPADCRSPETRRGGGRV